MGVGLRHDSHYVEELTRSQRTIGKMIPTNKIEPNPDQPRAEIGDLSELVSSVKEKGILEPLLVKPLKESHEQTAERWLIIAGERRWRAASIVGLKELPCIEMDLTENEVAEIALIENLQRKDLTVWEEADGLSALIKRFGYTHEDVARKIGKSRSTVTEMISVSSLPEKIRQSCIGLKINSKSSLLQIARQFDEASMFEFIDKNFNPDRAEDNSLMSSKTSRDERKQVKQELLKSFRNKDVKTESDKLESSEMKKVEAVPSIYTYKSPVGEFEVEVRLHKSANTKENIKRILSEAIDSL
jgi:ParB family chromosome partitioning protein